MRNCIFCNREIKECMGHVLARDILDRRMPPRECCGICGMKEDLVDLLKELDKNS